MTHGTISIPEVRSAFRGHVIAPDDPEYDRARVVHDGSVDRRPAVIIRPADPSEVAKVVALARETAVELQSAAEATAARATASPRAASFSISPICVPWRSTSRAGPRGQRQV